MKTVCPDRPRKGIIRIRMSAGLGLVLALGLGMRSPQSAKGDALQLHPLGPALLRLDFRIDPLAPFAGVEIHGTSP